MALLQNNTDNIISAENDRMERVDDMENAKKSVEAAEAKGDAKEIADNSEQAVEKPNERNEAAEENVMDTSEKTSQSSASTKQPSKEEKADDELPQSTPGKKDSADEAEEEEEDDDGEDEHESKKGLYDLPLEVEGKRERHKVERIAIATPTPKKAATTIQMGDGVPLGEIAYIEDQLQKHRAEELKTMHRVLYGNPGKLTTIKKEIRKFSGFGFKEDSPEFKRKFALVSKLTLDQLKLIRNVLGLHSGGHTKDALVTTIMVFLMKTVDHARRVPKATKRKSSTKTPTSAKRVKKAKGSNEVVSDDEDEDDDDEEEKKPAAKTPAKTPAKASAKTPTKASTKTPKKADTAKTPRKKRESTASKDTTSKAETDSDDSGPKKKPKETSKKDSDDDTSSSTSVETHEESKPTDKELEDVIEELLSQVDLSQVSMKQMCQAVIEKFPGTNIATRVDYLKSKIKQSLSTK